MEGVAVTLKVGDEKYEVGVCEQCVELFKKELPGVAVSDIITRKHTDQGFAKELEQGLDAKRASMPLPSLPPTAAKAPSAREGY